MRIPSNSPVTPGYGFGSTLPPYSPSNPHNGVDFQHDPDNIIYAPFSGRVTQGYNDRDGNGSYMTDPQGRFHGMLHASKYLVQHDTYVLEGQPIAVMGDTGLAEGVHLHWCVKEGSRFINPMSLIKEEPMFNEGDRLNINNYLYGGDKGLFKDLVDLDWKTAMYSVFATNGEFDFEYKVNSGDIANINTLLNVTDAENTRAQNWKDTFYKYVAPKFDEKNKIIAGLQMVQGDVEANTIGKALIKLFQSFGYKKS
jgi:hypothetical protein